MLAIDIDNITNVEHVNEVNVIPTDYSLEQNFPNPFNPSTSITYGIAESGLVKLSVYNLLGQNMATLVNEVKEPGYYKLTWEAHNLPSGIYFIGIHSDDIYIKKIIIR